MKWVDGGCWEFQNPVQIIFGAGRLAELGHCVASRKALLITTPGFTARRVTDRVLDLLGSTPVRVWDKVRPNPDLSDIEEAGYALLDEPAEVLIALGGGSALDTAKAVCIILSSGDPGVLRAHLENKAPLPPGSPLPLIAVPTTVGTGSEVTPFATLWDYQSKSKHSIDTPGLYPKIALLDPELTLTLPNDLTISSGLDALAHGMESIWNRRSTPLATLYALEAVGTAIKTLPELIEQPDSLKYRSRMMKASLLAGLAISQTRTALCHSMSYPLTSHFGVPHGLACGFTLPAVLEFNQHQDDGRLNQAAKKLGYSSIAALKKGLAELLASLGVGAALRSHISSVEELVGLAPNMLNSNRATNNLRTPDTDDVETILRESWSTVAGA